MVKYFWKSVPNKGEISIFDRSWYGRVMVEPIEGFCSLEELQRAYGEINQMEADWEESGILVLKFWLHIDKEEQKKRLQTAEKNLSEKKDAAEKECAKYCDLYVKMGVLSGLLLLILLI